MGEVLDLRGGLRGDSPSMAGVQVCAALELNDELFTSIVTRPHMPVQKIFQLHSVCKAWRAALADPHFLKYFFQLLGQTPLYVVASRYRHHTVAACDIRIKSWHKWVSTVHCKDFLLYNVHGAVGEWMLVKKRWDRKRNRKGIYLVNPRKRFFKKLQSFSEDNEFFKVRYAMGVGLDESCESCRVFEIERLDDYSHVYLYDFKLKSWNEFATWKTNYRKSTYNLTYYEGALYCIIKTIESEDEWHFITNVCRFDERNSRWQELPAQISGQLNFQNLFEWQGQLMLIGGRGGGQLLGHSERIYLTEDLQHHESRLTSVHIWRLDKKNQVWVESLRMPDHLVNHFYWPDIQLDVQDPEFYFMITCKTCSDQICLTSTAFVRRGGKSVRRRRQVMCDLSKASWWDVPEPPFPYYYSGFSVLLPNSEFQEC